MLHDRSLRKGRDRSLTIERDRVRTHAKIIYILSLPESIDYKGHHFDQADEGTLPVVEDPQIGQHEGKI